MAKKMYIAVGTNVEDRKTFTLSARSPYAQMALVFFATSRERATTTAKKLLGNAPKCVYQIGRVDVDVSKSKLHPPMLGAPRLGKDNFHVMDMSDTNEGCIVMFRKKSDGNPSF